MPGFLADKERPVPNGVMGKGPIPSFVADKERPAPDGVLGKGPVPSFPQPRRGGWARFGVGGPGAGGWLVARGVQGARGWLVARGVQGA